MFLRKSDQDHFPKPVEMTIVFLIIAVIVFTVIEELAIIYHWKHVWMVRLAWIAFCFDLFFSLEFVARGVRTARHNHFWYYVKNQRGWVDFITSWPLLLLVSGPTVIIMLYPQPTGEGGSELMNYLSILKSAKAIRVSRILRLIRIS